VDGSGRIAGVIGAAAWDAVKAGAKRLRELIEQIRHDEAHAASG
jgi:hypothetical protein